MSQQGNIILGFPNRLISDTTLSGGSWLAQLPLSNLKDRLFQKVARSTNAQTSSTQFLVDFGQPRKIRILAFVNHNFSLGAKIRIEAATDTAFTPEDPAPINAPAGSSMFLDFQQNVGWTQSSFSVLYDGQFDAWGSLVNAEWRIDELEWEADNYWNGTYTAEEIAGMTPISHMVLPGDVYARYWRISIIDEENPDEYVQFGRLFMSSYVQPEINYSYGAAFGYETTTSVETSLSGAEFFDVRDNIRYFRFVLEHLDDAQAYGDFLEIMRRAGIHEEIFVIPDPDDLANAQRRNFLGRMRQMNPLEQVMWMNEGVSSSLAFEIKELR